MSSEFENDQPEQEILYIADTETTGFNPDTGDRILEIGIVEIIDRQFTGRIYHQYIDPERDVPEDASKIHGITRDDAIRLSGGKNFSMIAHEFLAFMGLTGTKSSRKSNVKIVAHNAPFDVKFINSELNALRIPAIEELGIEVIDSLPIARKMLTKGNHKLDTLAAHYLGSNTYEREYHGALKDAMILARVYLAMTVSQKILTIDPAKNKTISSSLSPKRLEIPNGALKKTVVSEAERDSNRASCERIRKASGGHCFADSLSL